MDAALGALQWVVSKALAPVAGGVLEAWESGKNLGLNIEALSKELLAVQATLETASRKQLGGQAMETLLQKLQDSAHNAEDLLDELDYFRIHDALHSTYDAADEHAKGCVHNLMLNVRHAAKAASKTVGLSTRLCATSPTEPEEEDARQRVMCCCAWPRPKQRARGSSSSAANANQPDGEVGGGMRKLGKLLLCSSSPHVHDGDSGKSTLSGVPQREHSEETPKPVFNRVVISETMKHIVEQLQPLRREFTTILQSCGPNTVPNTLQSRPITNDQSIEPKLYGRDLTVNNIIHDITKVKYCDKDISVLPIVGPGGIGKTTMIQHIYHKKEVQNHFQVMIWVCVSLSFNLNKLLEEIKEQIPPVEGKTNGRPEVLIQQRLKGKRFLLVLDDMWECNNEDDWNRLLLPLKTSQQKGSMILVTTRFPAIAQIVKTTHHSIELQGLESEEFRKLFLAFVFGDEQCTRDHISLLDTGDKIMAKLKGYPLAAKTVGRILRKNLNLRYWRRVLESKAWESKTSDNDIMPALKLSYDYLPFHLQKCFSYSALFPEDYHFRSSVLINLWIALDILQPDAQNPQNKTYEEIGSSNLEELVTHGFFKEEETCGHPSYVMHDLLHDLAVKVASRECLSLHRSSVESVQIQPCIRHLSIIIDDVQHYNEVSGSGEKFKSELRKLKTRLKVEHLQTLMLFGEMDQCFVIHNSFANILGDVFREATALRVLHMPQVSQHSVESILHNFSSLIHLRYLCLGTRYQHYLPRNISRFYHLRILDLGSWCERFCDLPRDMSNLAKLCRFYTPSDELHSDIYNVGKLKLLEELKVFRVNKEIEGFKLKELENLTELRELGIYNLEKIHTKGEASKAKLMEKNYLERLTLEWDSNAELGPDIEAEVLESLQPHTNLQELCIRGHKSSSCPTWLGDELAVEALKSLHLVSVSWEVFPSLGKTWSLDKLILKHIATVKEFAIEQSFCKLRRFELVGLGSFEKWVPRATAHLFPLLQVLIIRDCPKLLELPFSSHYPPDQDRNIDWFSKLQELEIEKCPELLLVARIPWTETLRSVKIRDVKLLEKLDYSISWDGLKLEITGKDDLHSLDKVLAFSNLKELEVLRLEKCPLPELKYFLMLTSLQSLYLHCMKGMAMLEPLSKLTSLTLLIISDCGEDLRCEGLQPLLTTGGQLSELRVFDCPRFFAGWDPRSEVLQVEGGGEEHQLQLVSSPSSSTLRELMTDAGFLTAPICSLLSSSLTILYITRIKEMERFTKEQEDALHLLASLQELHFSRSNTLQYLPAGLHKLTNLKRLVVYFCPAIRSLPEDGLPRSLQELEVRHCRNEELRQQCRGWKPIQTSE